LQLRIGRNKESGMAHDLELDAILASLARVEMAAFSDLLLDLRNGAFPPAEAGCCVRIYFELLAAAPENGSLDQALADLRGWLERQLSIEVLDDAQMQRIERLPVRFEGQNDLETFCRSTMQDFFNDRCHPSPSIRMQFAFVSNS
jgi:hypothetical protein